MNRLIREISFIALAAIVTLGTIISANASGISTIPAPDADPAPRLFASGETRLALGGMAEHLAEWATMDVLVVSRDDLARQDASYSADPTAALRRFVAGIDEFPSARLDREGLGSALARDAADSSPHAFPMPARLAGEKPVCAVSLPDMAETSPDRLISAVTNLSRAKPDHVPGSAEAWQLLIVAHEIAHCRHSYDDQRAVVGLQFEREADQFAIDIYRKYGARLLGEGKNDQAVPSALVAFRGIAALRSGFIIHSTSAALNSDGAVFLETDDARLGEAKIKAQNAVWTMATSGRPDREEDAERPRPYEMYTAARSLYDSGYFDSTPLQKRYIKTFLDGAERFFPTYFQVPVFHEASASDVTR